MAGAPTSAPTAPVSNRRQRIILYAILIFAVIPAGLAALFLFSGGFWIISGVLTTYYVLAIAGVTIILFEQLWKDVRGPRTSPY